MSFSFVLSKQNICRPRLRQRTLIIRRHTTKKQVIQVLYFPLGKEAYVYLKIRSSKILFQILLSKHRNLYRNTNLIRMIMGFF